MMFAVKIKNGPIGALRNNRWAACTAPSKAYSLLTGYLIRLLVTLQKHAHAIYRDFLLKNFSRKSVIFFLFLLQNIDYRYSLEPPPTIYVLGEAVLTSTHNLCFGAKIRK